MRDSLRGSKKSYKKGRRRLREPKRKPKRRLMNSWLKRRPPSKKAPLINNCIETKVTVANWPCKIFFSLLHKRTP